MASPDCGVSVSRIGRIGEVGRCPFIRYWSIPATAVEWDQDLIGGVVVGPAPDNHFVASPHRFVFVSGRGSIDRSSGGPAVGAGVVFRARINMVEPVFAPPDDHFAPTPHCRVSRAAIGRIGQAGR